MSPVSSPGAKCYSLCYSSRSFTNTFPPSTFTSCASVACVAGIVTAAPDGSLQVRLTGSQGSGVLNSMVQANGLIVLDHEHGAVAPGDEVSVMMFDGAA